MPSLLLTVKSLLKKRSISAAPDFTAFRRVGLSMDKDKNQILDCRF